MMMMEEVITITMRMSDSKTANVLKKIKGLASVRTSGINTDMVV